MPKIRGGGYDENNIVLACAQCNSVKDDMTEVEFRNFWAKGKLPRTYVEYLADSKLAKLKLPLR